MTQQDTADSLGFPTVSLGYDSPDPLMGYKNAGLGSGGDGG